jgi:hypothetical protein
MPVVLAAVAVTGLQLVALATRPAHHHHRETMVAITPLSAQMAAVAVVEVRLLQVQMVAHRVAGTAVMVLRRLFLARL